MAWNLIPTLSVCRNHVSTYVNAVKHARNNRVCHAVCTLAIVHNSHGELKKTGRELSVYVFHRFLNNCSSPPLHVNVTDIYTAFYEVILTQNST